MDASSTADASGSGSSAGRTLSSGAALTGPSAPTRLPRLSRATRRSVSRCRAGELGDFLATGEHVVADRDLGLHGVLLGLEGREVEERRRILGRAGAERHGR